MTNAPEKSGASEASEPRQPVPTDASQADTEDALDDALRMTFPASDPVAMGPARSSTTERRTVRRANAYPAQPMDGG